MSKTQRRKTIYSYKLHPSMRDSICFYCGGLWESKDHIPPISYAEYVEEENRLLVRSCILCNTLLNKRSILTILARCDYLLIKYNKRFKRLLEMPLWKPTEIEEMEGKLKRQIIQAIKKKAYIEGKILFIQKTIEALQGY